MESSHYRAHLVLLLVLLATVCLAIGLPDPGEPFPAATRLLESQCDRRSVEGRLSFSCKLPKLQPLDKALLRKAKIEIEKALDSGEKSQALYYSALLDLLIEKPEPQLLMRVAAKLEKGLREGSTEVRNLNDLSAVYLALGDYDSSYYIKALSLASRARRLAPQSPVVHFNLALALQKLRLEDAKAGWLASLKLEPSQAWRREAESHLAALEGERYGAEWEKDQKRLALAAFQGDEAEVVRIVARYPLAVRVFAEELIATWADAASRQEDVRAARSLSLARDLGRALAALNRDPLLEEAVEGVVTASSSTKDARFRKLVDGYLRLGQGMKHYERRETEDAAADFAAAEQLLEAAGSPFHLWARFYQAACLYFTGDVDRSFAEFKDLLPLASGYPSLEGRIHWSIGLIHGVRGNFPLALEQYTASLAIFERLREFDHEAAVSFLLSEILHELGQETSAWRYRYHALSLRGKILDPLWQHSVLWGFSDAATRAGDEEAASIFQGDLLKIAESTRQAALVGDVHLQRAATFFSLHRWSDAAAECRAARAAALKISGKAMRQRLLAGAALIEADLRLRTSPRAAVELLTAALSLFEEVKFQPGRVQIFLKRAEAFSLAGDRDAGRRDVDQALEEIRRQWGRLASEEARASFRTVARQVFDEAIRLASEEGEGEGQALALLEEVKSQGDRQGTKLPRATFNWKKVQQALEEGTVHLYYSVLKDRILIWVLSKSVFRSARLEVSPEALKEGIQRLRREAKTGGGDLERDLEGLYQDLIRPAEVDLVGARKVVVFPDKIIFAVPFAALKNAKTGRYLVESADVVLGLGRASDVVMENTLRHLGELRVLILANPAHDTKLFPDLESLPYAEQEAEDIQKLYGYGNTLKVMGRGVTRQALADGGREYDVLHFGGHAIHPEGEGSEPFLVLAPVADGKAPVLSASEIDTMNWSRTRLVVLGACNSGGGDGDAPLARAFLANGVSSVVSSLWSVNDRSSSSFLVSFHRYVSRGEIPSSALRLAQINALKSSDPLTRSPLNWGAFSIFVHG